MRGLLTALLLLLSAVWSAGATATDTVKLTRGMPLFAEPRFDAPVRGVMTGPGRAELLDETPVLVSRHPLARYYTFAHIRLADGVEGYVEPSTTVEPRAEGRYGLHHAPYRPWWRYGLGGLLLAALAGLGGEYLVRRRRERPYTVRERGWRLAAVLLLARQLLLLTVVQGGGNLLTSPADDVGYFQNALDFLRGDFSRPWHFTVGLSILYLPFILVTGAQEVTEIMVPFSWFSGMILAPLLPVLGFFIGRRLTGRDRAAFTAMAIWVVLPFFFHHLADFSSKVFVPDWGWPSFEFTFRHYITLIGTGFNAMSDTPSCFVVLLTILLALRWKPSPGHYLLLGMLFGFGCMIRINNIFFLPVIALLVWRRGGDRWRDIPFTGAALIAGAGGFLLGFLPQMVVNAFFYGHPLLFSYTRYAAGAHTYFSPIFFNLNTAYYGAVNQIAWIGGGCGLLLMRSVRLRTVLALWAVPVILFFCGYSHGTDDPIRFIMTATPALLLAAVGGECWRGLSRREWGFAALALTVFLAAPNATVGDWSWYLEVGHALSRPFREGITIYPALAGLLAAAWGLRRKRRCCVFVTLCGFLYLFGNAYVLAGLLTVALLRALMDLFRLVRFRTVQEGEKA